MALKPPFHSILEAIEFADGVLQINGAKGIDYDRDYIQVRNRGISNAYADAITVHKIIGQYDRFGNVRDYILSSGGDFWSEEDRHFIDAAIRRMTHHLCSLRFMYHCQHPHGKCPRKKNT